MEKLHFISFDYFSDSLRNDAILGMQLLIVVGNSTNYPVGILGMNGLVS